VLTEFTETIILFLNRIYRHHLGLMSKRWWWCRWRWWWRWCEWWCKCRRCRDHSGHLLLLALLVVILGHLTPHWQRRCDTRVL
jgi:hypothetical protein